MKNKIKTWGKKRGKRNEEHVDMEEELELVSSSYLGPGGELGGYELFFHEKDEEGRRNETWRSYKGAPAD